MQMLMKLLVMMMMMMILMMMMMVYLNSYIAGKYNPLYTLNNWVW